MTGQAAEEYRRITGREPLKPFAERTHEERVRALDAFTTTVNESDMDEAVDELFAHARLAFASTTAVNEDADAA